MSGASQIELSCPHCGRVYRLRLDLKSLSDARSSARCGRCGKRFSLSKRARDSKTFPAIREEEIPSSAKRRPLRRRGERRHPTSEPSDAPGPPPSSQPPPSGRRPGRAASSAPPSRPGSRSKSPGAYSPKGPSPFARGEHNPPSFERPDRPESDTDPSVEAPERHDANPSPRRISLADLEEPPLRASIAEPLPRTRRSTPRLPSEPPPEAQPFVPPVLPSSQLKRPRRRTQPHLVGPAPSKTDPSRFDRPTDPDLDLDLEASLIPPPGRLMPPKAGRTMSDPRLGIGAPVGGDVASHVAPVEMSLLPEDLTPVPSHIMGPASLLDPDEWLARADPGLDALSASRSDVADALRWLLEEDRS